MKTKVRLIRRGDSDTSRFVEGRLHSLQATGAFIDLEHDGQFLFIPMQDIIEILYLEPEGGAP